MARNVAEVAVAALTGPEHEECAYTPAGPELLSVPDQATVLTGDVEQVTGRSPRGFRAWIVDHIDAFR